MPEDPLAGEFDINEPSEKPSENTDSKNEENNEEFTAEIEKPADKKGSHFYSSFAYFPNNITLSNQEKDEEIILVIRRRFVVNVPWIASSLFFALVVPPFLPFFEASLPINPIEPFQRILILALYYLVIFGFVLLNFTLWYFHVSVVTNKRIVDVDIHGILLKDVAETRLNQVQDVNYKQIGFLPSLFNYGEVYIQTAGATPNIEFDKAPEPARIAKIIADMIKKHS